MFIPPLIPPGPSEVGFCIFPPLPRLGLDEPLSHSDWMPAAYGTVSCHLVPAEHTDNY